MRICSFVAHGGATVRCGVLDQDRVVTVDVPDVLAFLAAGLAAGSGRHYDLVDVRLVAPVPRPPSIRDFFAFERHIATARASRGMPVPDFWYEEPVFYFSNPAAVVGPGVEVAYPLGTAELDFELELAAVIGADEEIAGFTIMNDWSARDVQRREVSVGLGPAKAKDFATSLGPVLVTVDEFDGSRGRMLAHVNGREQSCGDAAELHFSWETMRERAGRNTELRPGDVLGSGTVGSGCLLEAQPTPWLEVGDVVTLEIEGLGRLENRVGALA